MHSKTTIFVPLPLHSVGKCICLPSVRLFIHPFVWIDLVTTISRERLQQP